MTVLENRIKKLEASKPELNPLAELTYEELKNEMFSICQKMHELGMEIEPEIAITNSKCRQFFTGTPWVMDHNHRLGVFFDFKGIILGQDLPNQQRIESILNLGWGNNEIDSKDIDWLVAELNDVDLGEESPWLKGYLEHSGENPSPS